MQKIIVELCVFRHGVERFEKRVNAELASGWVLAVDNNRQPGRFINKHGWFRTVCTAVLVKENQ